MPKRTFKRSSYARKSVRRTFRSKGRKSPYMSRTKERQSYTKHDLSAVRGVVNLSKQIKANYATPSSMLNTHKYTSGPIAMSPGVAGLNGTTYYFRLNSLFAPDFTNTVGQPHQPYLYDQMRSLYETSTVYAVKVTVEVISANTDSNNGGIVCFAKSGLDIADPVGQTLNQWMEKPNAGIVVPRVATTASPAANGAYVNEVRSKTFYLDIAQLFGITRTVLFDGTNSYAGNGNANPSNYWLFGISAGAFDLNAGSIMTTIVTLEYQAKWTNPVVQNSS